MKTLTLGELEKQIMEIIWERKVCSVRDVQVKIRRKHLAYTTIATILHRLCDKGLLTRKKDGKGFLYAPKLSKEKYSKRIASSFLEAFFHSYGDAAIASFAKSVESLPKEKKTHFLRLLGQYENRS